ncbi:MAG: DUF4442 domain-containing protein [Terriglobia bacterium]
MPESLRSKLLRWRFNFFPALRGTGARITYMADDFREVRIKLPLNWRTRNYVGSIYGGSMYAAVDPFYMVMLIRNLGPAYVVWDRSATIHFKKPGRSTLYARFVLGESELEAIKAELAGKRSLERTYHIELTDARGTVYASVDKVIHIAMKKPKGETK